MSDDVEYRCKKHPKVRLKKGKRAAFDRKMRFSGDAPAVIPDQPMYCKECDKYYYEWQCEERRVKH